MTPRPARVEVLLSNDRGIGSLAFDGDVAFLSLYTGTEPAAASAVLRSDGGPLHAGTRWADVSMGDCALQPASGVNAFARAPQLTYVAGRLHLLNEPILEDAERTLCVLDKAKPRFEARDQGLRTCHGESCHTLAATQLKQVGNRLFINAGAGDTVLASDDRGESWRVVTGRFDTILCYFGSFHVVGQRLLVGGECPLDLAYFRAYTLTADGGQLASPAQPVQHPDLGNRNVQFIESAPGSQRVFAGVEGGLLRSDDGGASFKFVIQDEARKDARYAYVKHLLQPKQRPGVVVVAGWDKPSGRPFLSWSADGGDRWTDLSALLPGYQQSSDRIYTEVTSLVEDLQGNIFLTLSVNGGIKGQLLRVELGNMPG